MRAYRLFSVFPALALLASVAEAQRINTIKPTSPTSTTSVGIDGIVRDREGRALAAAEVIIDEDHRTITNSRGEFSITGLEPGTIELTARRIGYNPAITSIQIDPGVTAHLAIRLTPIAIQLGTMVIEGKRMDKALWQTGFYQRQSTGAGKYFDDDFMRSHQTSVGTIVSQVPAVFLDRMGPGRTVALGRLPNGTGCLLSVFVDGNYISWANEGIDEIVNRNDVLAVEVYSRASEMPATITGRGGSTGYGNIGAINLRASELTRGPTTGECGSILIWTKPLGGKK